MYKQATLADKPTIFLDPNGLSIDGTIALKIRKFSNDGSKLAYSISESGSDWQKFRIRDVETGKDHPEILENIKFSEVAWTANNEGFFYNVNEYDFPIHFLKLHLIRL